jgi:subtilisin family serine protease
VTYDGSGSAPNEVRLPSGEIRRGPDPDNFAAGFAVWSGTSFAAPYFAGQVAAALQRRFESGDDGIDPPAAVARARRVLADQPKRGRT